MKLQDRYCQALKDRGHLEVPGTFKYRKFRRYKNGIDTGYLYYVGRAGSLRVGKNQAMSHPVSEVFKRDLLYGNYLRTDLPS